MLISALWLGWLDGAQPHVPLLSVPYPPPQRGHVLRIQARTLGSEPLTEAAIPKMDGCQKMNEGKSMLLDVIEPGFICKQINLLRHKIVSFD